MKSLENFLFIIYKIIFDLIYLQVIGPNYAYFGMYKDFNLSKYIIGWVIFFILLTVIQKLFKRSDVLSSYVIKLLFILSMIPQFSLLGIKNYDYTPFLLMIVYWLIFILSMYFIFEKCIKTSNKNGSNPTEMSSTFTTRVLSIISLIVVLYISWRYTALRVTLDFSRIFEYRSTYAQANTSIFINYALPLTASVILPYCFMIYVFEKKIIRASLIFFLGILAFSISGMKAWLFIYIVVMGIAFIDRLKQEEKVIIWFLILIIIISLIVYGIYIFTGNSISASYHNRVFSYPSEINYYYYNFFSKNEFLYLRESVFRHMFKSPYELKSTALISYQYSCGTYTNNVVNGLFGDAYANFGVLGVFVYPIILTIIMSSFYNLFRGWKDNRYMYSIIFAMIWGTLNTSLFTWLLTGGVLTFYFLIFISNFNRSK